MEIKLLSCPLCLKPHFQGVDALRTSLISVATSPLACPVCNELFMGLDKLTIHLFSHITINSYQPHDSINQNNNPAENYEEKNDVQMNDMENHCETAKIVSVEKPKKQPEKKAKFRCDICNFYFNEEHILEMHQKLLHQTSMDSKTGAYSYHCHLCTKKFKMKGSLMVHLRVAHYGFVHHLDDQELHSSESDNSNQLSMLPAHSNLHLKVESQESILDGQKLNSAHGRDLDSGDVNMNCNQEETKLVGKDNKQWECDVCSKMFTTKYFLKKHKRLHTGEMPYFCNLCNKSFTFQQSYHKHMLYHTSEKPHVCNECGRAFKELSTLHNHQRIHSGERPFACETCGKCFRQRVSYLVHRRIHTGVMPYKCTACNKSFRYKVSQRSHKCTANPPGIVVRSSEVSETQSNWPVATSDQEPKSLEYTSQTRSNNENKSNQSPRNEVPNIISIDSLCQQNVNTETSTRSTLTAGVYCVKTEDKSSNQQDALVFHLDGEIIPQNFSFAAECEIIPIPNNSTPQINANSDLSGFPSTEKQMAPNNHDITYSNGGNCQNSSADVVSPHLNISYDPPDFFSMVLSTSPPSMLPDVQSLHLNSPKDKQDEQERMLETINEESLKELLYGNTN